MATLRPGTKPGGAGPAFCPGLLTQTPTAMTYDLIGKRVRVHLYSRDGLVLGSIEGRVADVAEAVEVGKHPDGTAVRKDLAYVVDIASPDPETPYRNSAGEENEGWFAIQDLEVIDENRPRLFAN